VFVPSVLVALSPFWIVEVVGTEEENGTLEELSFADEEEFGKRE